MNKNCGGDYYQIGGEQFYRCILDGVVLRASHVGATCPNCGRAITGATRHGRLPANRVRRTMQVQLGDLGWIPHIEVR